jgi:predicted membrane-bound dolichyl-phosphate-mannose-protein mannosyltransferase
VPTKITNRQEAIRASPKTLKRYRQEDTQINSSTTFCFPLTPVLNWFKIRENQLIFSLVLLALLMHLLVVPYFHFLQADESYYVPEARSIIHQRTLLTPEHPSLGKLLIASGILTFGDNPWGWRIPSVLFGVVSLILFYLICKRLANRQFALLASFLLLFESLTFTMSGIAMLDVFSLTFMLLSFLLYLNNRYVFSGISLALSASCKLTGLLGIFVIVGYWLIRKDGRSLRNITLFLLVLFVAFLVFLPVSDFVATGHWTSPMERVAQMEHISSQMTFEWAKTLGSGSMPTSYPWTWILSLKGYRYLAINPAIWILIIPSIGVMTHEFIKRRTEISLFVLLWFTATYLLWIPLVLLTDRQTFIFYFYFAVGPVCMGISSALTKIWDFASKGLSVPRNGLIKVAVIAYLASNIVLFLDLIPILSSIYQASNTIR